MNAKALIPGVLGALCLVAITVAVKQARWVGDAETSRRNVIQQRVRASEEIRREQDRLAAAERKCAELQFTLAALPAGRSVPPPSAPNPRRADEVLPWWKEALQNDPTLQALQLDAARVSVRQRYGAFFRNAGLTAEQQERFSRAVLLRDERVMDIDSVAHAQGLKREDPAITGLKKAAGDELRAVQVELLGEHGLRRLQEYDRLEWVPVSVTRLAGLLATTDAPLSVQQAEQLMQVIANASRGYRSGGKVDSNSDYQDEMNNPLWRGPVSDPFDAAALFQNARAVLSEQQFAFFGAHHAQILTPKMINAAREFTRRAKDGARNSGAAPTAP
jgi:hypothetical protein